MKRDFIIKFLEALKDTVVDIGTSWSQISYKGVRYSTFLKSNGPDFRRQYVGFKNMEQRGFIKNTNRGRFIFTKNGQKWLNRSFVRYFNIKIGSKWDKKWRIIIFDIPQELNKERVKFRRKLKWLGCEMIQESVFVFPYPCEVEISNIAKNLGVADHIDIILAESPGFREKEFRKFFNL